MLRDATRVATPRYGQAPCANGPNEIEEAAHLERQRRLRRADKMDRRRLGFELLENDLKLPILQPRAAS